jgi:hypothetical protein
MARMLQSLGLTLDEIIEMLHAMTPAPPPATVNNGDSKVPSTASTPRLPNCVAPGA